MYTVRGVVAVSAECMFFWDAVERIRSYKSRTRTAVYDDSGKNDIPILFSIRSEYLIGA